MHRVKVIYTGRVQGVGFRARVAELAARFSILGRVRNLDNGDVELIAEGSEIELVELHAAIVDLMRRNVVSSHQDWSEIDHTSFQQFQIAW